MNSEMCYVDALLMCCLSDYEQIPHISDRQRILFVNDFYEQEFFLLGFSIALSLMHWCILLLHF